MSNQILPFNDTSADTEEQLPPTVYFGNSVNDAPPPSLRLKAYPMRLAFVDPRASDAGVLQWLQNRKLGVGASEIATLFGLNPWQNVRELWSLKVHDLPSEGGNELFHFGHEMEPLIAKEFALRSGETVAEPSEAIIIGSKPHYRASLDRVIIEDGEETAALELKNLHEGRLKEYMTCGPSTQYLLQLQYQMACAGMEYGYLAALFGGQKFAAWRVVASPSIQAEIFRRVDQFWEYVESKTEPPEIIGGRALANTGDGTLVLTDPEWEERLSELEQLRLKKAKIEKEEKLLKQSLKETLGDATSAKAGRMAVSVSISRRSSLDTTKLKEEQPELVARYTKEASVKTLRVRSTGDSK
jgi:putative phage-type endonuclease